MKSSVIQYNLPTSLPWSERLVSRLSESNYRHAYMIEGVKTWIARQVRTLREQRGWSQEDLGRETGKPQSAISRVEDPDYGKLTLQTLFDLARAYDLPLLVQFLEWGDWLSRMDDVSTEVLQKESFSAEALRGLGTGQIVIEPKHIGPSVLMGRNIPLTNATVSGTGAITVYGHVHGQVRSTFEDIKDQDHDRAPSRDFLETEGIENA